MPPIVGLVQAPLFLEHRRDGHPERPERLVAIAAELERTGLSGAFRNVDARPASREELLLAHDAAHLDQVGRLTSGPPVMLDEDTYANEHTWQAAVCAAGGAVDLTAAVLRGELDRGLALVRPPGHHATPSRTMGFCVFNNVAVAARAAQAMAVGGGAPAKPRIAVVDFDVHHGNGTQDIFYDDPSVLFISLHQFPLWPGTGWLTEAGDGAALGLNVNIPLPPGTGDGGLRAAVGRIVLPALRRFAPELLIISGGWDAHWRDPLAQLQYTLSGYAWACRQLVQAADELCGGRVVTVLEGGYDTEVLAVGVANLARALLGRDEQEDPFGTGAAGEADAEAILQRLERAPDGGN